MSSTLLTPMPIAKVTVGKSAYGCLNYVLTKDKAELLDTNCAADTPAVLAREFEVAFQPHYRNGAKRHTVNYVAHFSIAFPYEVEPSKLRAIAHRFMDLMGFDPIMNQFVLAQHKDTDDCHMHLVENRIRLDGKVVSDSFQQRRTEVAMRTIEIEFDLPRLKNSWEVDVRAPHVAEVRQSRETGKPIPRRVLQETIERCVVGSRTLEQLQVKLQESGVTLTATPRDDGSWALLYQLALEDGKQRTFSATKLGKRYTKRGLQSTFGVSFGDEMVEAVETAQTATTANLSVLPLSELPVSEPVTALNNASTTPAGGGKQANGANVDREGFGQELPGLGQELPGLGQEPVAASEGFGQEPLESNAETASSSTAPIESNIETKSGGTVPVTPTPTTTRFAKQANGANIDREGFGQELPGFGQELPSFGQEPVDRARAAASLGQEPVGSNVKTASGETGSGKPHVEAEGGRSAPVLPTNTVDSGGSIPDHSVTVPVIDPSLDEWATPLTAAQATARAESLQAVLRWTQTHIETLAQRGLWLGLQNAADQERWSVLSAQAQQRGLSDPQQIESAVTVLACQQGYKTRSIVRLLQQSPRVQQALEQHDFQTVAAALTQNVVQVRQALQQQKTLEAKRQGKKSNER